MVIMKNNLSECAYNLMIMYNKYAEKGRNYNSLLIQKFQKEYRTIIRNRSYSF